MNLFADQPSVMESNLVVDVWAKTTYAFLAPEDHN